MREFKNHILGEIPSMQKSIEELDPIVKTNEEIVC